MPDELNTDNNKFTDGTIKILHLGDINADGTVNLADLILLSQAYGSKASDPIPPWNPNADLSKDNITTLVDL